MRPRVDLTVLPILLGAAIVTGCAITPDVEGLSTSQRARFDSMEVWRGPTTRSHTTLVPVAGLSCRRFAHQQLSEAEAIEGVRVRAASLDADAVVNLACQAGFNGGWANDCELSIVCVGDPVRYKR
jgi:hypothetical protein